jgi:cell wall-associated NlpC family hydrolase
MGVGIDVAPPETPPNLGPIDPLPPEGPPLGEGPSPDLQATEGAENITGDDLPHDDPPPPLPPAPDEPDVHLAGNVTPDPDASGTGMKAVDAARAQIGTPYVWGGKAPGGFDCSGLVSYALNQAGLMDGYKTSQQMAKDGIPVDEKDVRPGDVVVYGEDAHHVAIVSSVNPTKIIQAQQSGTNIAEGDVTDGGKDFKFVRFEGKGGDKPEPDTISV